MRAMAAMALAAIALAAMTATVWAAPARETETIKVGSKRFTESYILGEILAQAARSAGTGIDATHEAGLGNTAVVVQALKAGAIDVYPEYLGTIASEIVHLGEAGSSASIIESLRGPLAAMGLGVGVPLGFTNGYALAMTRETAGRLGVQRVGDLAAHPDLVFGLSHEFLGRTDGWPGLAAAYGLPQRPIGIDHGLAYSALQTGRIAVTDIYTTDAKIAELGLRVLDDDRAYFPRYDAVLLYRLDLPQRAPRAWRAIQALAGRIDQRRMIEMNGQAELQGLAFADIAAGFLASEDASQTLTPVADAAPGESGMPASSRQSASRAAPDARLPAPPRRTTFLDRLFGDDLWRLTKEHLLLVGVAVGVAMLIGIPLGAAAAARPRLEQPVMAVTGLLQTIPSLALLAMLIPLLGRIGTVPALVALALYALLPIVRNTTTGLAGVPAGLKQAGTALGLGPWQRWLSVDLPLAAPVMLAGIKTAAVITVGTATIAAFIGAGGYGERISTGLALNDHDALLAGAIPAAAMALLMQAVFELAERRLLAWQRPRPE